MGVKAYVNADKYPKQGAFLGKRVKVCFNYDTSRQFPGVVIRDDMTEPGLCIISLDDGRALLATECQYSLE